MPGGFLRVVDGVRRGLNVPLPTDGSLLIGRKTGDLVIPDPLVSSRHAAIVPRDGGWVLQDLGSTNGTMVDGRLVMREVALRAPRSRSATAVSFSSSVPMTTTRR